MPQPTIPPGSDLEAFIALYRKVGVELEAMIVEGRVTHCAPETPPGFEIEMMQGEDPKFYGYSGFHSSIHFNEAGEFLYQAFWE